MDLDELRERAVEAADAADRVRNEHVDALEQLQQLEIEVARTRVLHYHSIGEEPPQNQDLGEFDPRIYVARRKLKFKEAELTTLDQRDIEATKAFSDAVAASHEKRLAREHEASEHWHRRFHTSLSIANGGAFLAIASHVFDKDAAQAAIEASFWVLSLFSVGLVLGGVIPLVLAREVDGSSRKRSEEEILLKHSISERLAIGSTLFFALGLIAAMVAVWNLGHSEQDPKPTPAPQTKPGSPLTSPSRPAAAPQPLRPPPGTPAPQPQKSEPQAATAPRATDRTGNRG